MSLSIVFKYHSNIQYFFFPFRKPCSGFKLREMTGSSIFAVDGENGAPESGIAISTPNNKTGLKTYPVFFGDQMTYLMHSSHHRILRLI